MLTSVKRRTWLQPPRLTLENCKNNLSHSSVILIAYIHCPFFTLFLSHLPIRSYLSCIFIPSSHSFLPFMHFLSHLPIRSYLSCISYPIFSFVLTFHAFLIPSSHSFLPFMLFLSHLPIRSYLSCISYVLCIVQSVPIRKWKERAQRKNLIYPWSWDFLTTDVYCFLFCREPSNEKKQKHGYLIYTWSDKVFKGTVVNRTLSSLPWRSL